MDWIDDWFDGESDRFIAVYLLDSDLGDTLWNWRYFIMGGNSNQIPGKFRMACQFLLGGGESMIVIGGSIDKRCTEIRFHPPGKLN
jgi:hypothetical protein